MVKIPENQSLLYKHMRQGAKDDMKKKFLSVLLVLTMVLTMIPMATGVAWAGEEYIYSSGVTWKLEGNTLTIGGIGAMPNFGNESQQPWAASRTNITSVSINENVTSIGNNAFNGCASLISITIPTGVTSIGNRVFANCSKLTSIEIPSSVTSIGENAFNGCLGLTSIEIPSSVTSIGDSAFKGCASLTNIEIPSSVTSIGNSVFSGCASLTSITIPSSVTSIGNNAFDNCLKLTSIEIPSSVTSIGSSAFSGCASLTSITIPTGVTSIGANTFKNCSKLNNITILTGVTSIGMGAFNGCASLTSITIPESVINIDYGAFYNCSSLVSVNCLATIPPTLGSNVFYGCASPTSINVPDGKEFDYVASWTQYAANIVVSIADILATVDGEFPETVETGWVNGNGAVCYLASSTSKLTFVKDGETSKTEGTSRSTADRLMGDLGLHWSNGNYTDVTFGGYSLTFNMEDNKLTSIKYADYPDDGITNFSGTYTAPAPEPQAPSIGYFAYDVEKYREILAEAQKQQAAIDAEIAPVKPGEEEKPVGTPITEEQAKALVTEMMPVVRTENQARGIKVFLQDSPAINRFKAAGYKVLYDFYRAESKTAPKSEDYKITTVVNKEEPWYLNTAAKKGKRYYYKVVAKVYDAEGNLVGETELDQAAYGYRTRK